MPKSADAYRTISEVAEELKLPQHVLRFWETRFPQIRPMKRGGGRRFYRPEDIELLRAIKTLLYGDGYTIKGVQRILREQGPRAVSALAEVGFAPQARSTRPEDEDLDATEGTDDPRQRVGPGDSVPPGRPAAMLPPPRRGGAEAASKGARDDRTADRGASGAQAPTDLVGRLHAVLFELSECERLLAAVRATAA
jgi:DNA-binding transcriptional MerR regulator